MPGNGKVFVSYTPEDASLCLPLIAALDAWEVDYRAEPAALDATQQLPPLVQREISDRDVFVRICTPAAQRSIPLNLQVGVYRGLQANDLKMPRPALSDRRTTALPACRRRRPRSRATSSTVQAPTVTCTR